MAEAGSLGKGLFAARALATGETLFVPTGPIVPAQTFFSIQVDWNAHLHPDPPYRYTNHSCEPNVGVVSPPDRRPSFVTMGAVAKDAPLVFDYAMSEYRHYPRPNPQDEFDLTCRCGAASCRKRLGYYSELPESLRRKYRGFISAYLLAAPPEEN